MDFDSNLFSGRPAKRQKSDDSHYVQPVSPVNPTNVAASKGRTPPRVSPRSVLTYSSPKRRSYLANLAVQPSDIRDLSPKSPLGASSVIPNTALIDSAYHSIATTHEEASENENGQTHVTRLRNGHKKSHGNSERGAVQSTAQLKSKQIQKVTKSKAPLGEDILPKTDTSRRKGTHVISQEPGIEAIDPNDKDRSEDVLSTAARTGAEDDESAPTTRWSGRVRKKTWKQVAAEVKDLPNAVLKLHTTKDASTRRKRENSTLFREKTGDAPPIVASMKSTTVAVAVVVTPRKRGRPPKTPKSRSQGSPSAVFFEDIGSTRTAKRLTTEAKNTAYAKSNTVPAQVPAIVTPSKKGKKGASEDLALASSNIEPDFVDLDVPSKNTDGSDELNKLKLLLEEVKFAEAFITLKKEILLGLSGKERLPLIGFDDEYKKVHQVIEQTVAAGEGNSMLIIGARGSAKSTLVDSVLFQISEQHQADFHVIRLNGFVHTDDKLALREIWRQLGKEMQIDDEAMGTRGNYADALASLLAILSHPAELSGQETDQTSKSVIFILDEFDLFASHPRQTLLYNLFDIAQSRKAPIAVLGLTTKIDVAESLEKRVKSRFSHRYVHLSHPKSYSVFLSICKVALRCIPPTTSQPPPVPPMRSALSLHNPVNRILLSAWTAHVTATLTSPEVFPVLLRLYYQSKSVPTFLAALFPAVALSTPSEPLIATSMATFLTSLRHPDSKLVLLGGLADLELALLIAGARLDIILDTDAVNFNLAYDEYSRLADRARITGGAAGAAALGGVAGKTWGPDVALGAWERLNELGLLLPAGGVSGAGSGGMDLGKRGRLWKVDVSLEEIGASGIEMSAGIAKWCKEI